ncbi:MAG: reverse transcriptase domain-containing protein [Oscillospiraceae bacterium]
MNKRLAEYQKYIWEVKGVRPAISHGFEKGKSIITNAKIHRNKRYVVNLDIENFFGTFHFGRIVGFFEKNRYFRLPHEVAITIAQITCYNGTLPQGAPSSPIITNYICQVLDRRLLLLAREYRLDYTRYADDITFSTNDIHFTDKYRAFLDAVDTEIQRAGFRINSKKTRLLFESSRQEVTGLTVNKKINSNKQFRKETRAMAHHMYANGEFSIAGDSGTLEQLEGRFSFIDQSTVYKGLHRVGI